MAPSFSRLVRFEDVNGQVNYGEAGDEWHQDLVGRKVPTYNITDPFVDDFPLSGKEVEVAKVVETLDPNESNSGPCVMT